MDKQTLIDRLTKEILIVTFKKVSTGELRVLPCTLINSILPPLKGSGRKQPDDLVIVWDIENEGWRSFKLNSIVSVEDLWAPGK